MMRSLMILAAPALALGPCRDSEAAAIVVDTGNYEVKTLDIRVSNDLVSVNGIQAKKKSEVQMTELCFQLYDDVNGNGEIDAGETTETPYYVGDGVTPVDQLKIGAFNFRYGKAGSQQMNAFKGYVKTPEGRKQRFEGPIK